MPEKDPHAGELNPEVHHEHSDINVKALFWFTAIFIVFAIISHIGLWLFHGWLAKEEREAQAPPATLVRRDGPLLPPEPRLQPFPSPQQGRTGAEEPVTNQPVMNPLNNTPVFDMVEMVKEEDELLGNYGWVDRQKGVVRIPVAEAKKLMVARGVPVRQAVAPQPEAAPAAGPSSSVPAQSGVPAPAQSPLPQTERQQ